jgi:ABC-type branched-subunit amino acid transport system substrate-binding protein
MPLPTPAEGTPAPPAAVDFTPGRPPHLVLVVGSAPNAKGIENLRRSTDWAAVVPFGSTEPARVAAIALADAPEFSRRTPFRYLSMMLNARRGNLTAATETERKWEALADAMPRAGSFLAWLNRSSGSDWGSVTLPFLQLPIQALLAVPLRWALYGVARRRMVKATTEDGRWDVETVLEATAQLPAEDESDDSAAEGARDELAAVYRRAFVTDCSHSRIELVLTGLGEGDQASRLAAELGRVEGEAGEITAYEHRRADQPAEAGVVNRTLKTLRTRVSRYAQWSYFGVRPPRAHSGAVAAAVGLAAFTVIAVAAALVLQVVSGSGAEDCAPPFGRDAATERCLPVSDGSNCTDPVLKPACEVIARQNEAVGEDEDAFTLALALPMTFDGDDANVPTDIRNQIQGAAAAQKLINDGLSPKVRLLLTDLGSKNSAWEPAAEAIVERRDDLKIIGVTGLSSSFEDTESFIDRMSEEDLVVMGSTITGDGMFTDGPEENSSFRVAPTNTHEATALAAFIRERSDLCSVFNVSDHNRSYDYAITLNEAFKREQEAAGCVEKPRPSTYDGSVVTELNPSLFNQIVGDVCAEIEGDSYLFFAGHSGFALPSLIRSLSTRGGSHDDTCMEHEITIVTGDNAASIPHNPAVVHDLRAANVQLYYIGLAHPDQWKTAGGEFDDSAEFMESAVKQLEDQFGADADLENGQALMSYEALYVTALNAQVQGPTVTAASLAEALRGYSGHTATGPLRFDESGNPIGKTMTVLRATTNLDEPVAVVDLVTAA